MGLSRSFFAASLVVFCVGAAPAQAAVPHTVAPGETLWSIAAANNFTTRALAAANGLSEDAQVVTGTTIQIPSEAEAAAALGAPAQAPATPTTTANATGAGAPPPAGAYSVQPGDTLSAIAARSGVSVGEVAWMNGLDPNAPLLAGTALKLPTGSPLAGTAPASPAVVVPAAPYATPGTVSSADIGGIASANGVPSSLASAVAWQESGFNNGAVSAANARGVMQILPGTWTWIENELAGGKLDPASPAENVRAGVLYLRQLLADAGGDQSLAVASYYQGADSVRRLGMLPETQRYVADVMALQGRFGGP
jgi:soluble lytic murein transglycosylase-like protein